MLVFAFFCFTPAWSAIVSPWQHDLGEFEASLFTGPQQALIRGQLFHDKYDATAPYEIRKRVDIQMAYARALLGDVATAYQNLESLRLEIPSNVVVLHAHIQHTIGNLYLYLGDYAEASNFYFEALRLREKLNDEVAVNDTLNNIANVLRLTYRAAESISYFERIEKIALKNHDELTLGDAALGRVQALIQMQHFDEAEPLLTTAQNYFAQQNPMYWGAIASLAAESELAVLLKKSDRKLDKLALAIKRATEAGFPRLQMEIWQRQAQAYLSVGDSDAGLKLVQQGLTMAQQLRHQREQVDFELLQAQLLLAAKKYPEAAQAYALWHNASRAYNDERGALYTQLLQIRYQSAQKEQAIAELTKKTELQQLRLEQQSWRRSAIVVGAVLFAMVIMASVLYWSRRRELRRQQALNSRLLELDKLKDNVLANTSHELRTPLNGIVGLSEVMLMEEVTDEQRQSLELIANSGRRLSLLVNDLLDFAKLKHADIKLNVQTIVLKAAITQALALCQPSLGRKSLRLVNEVNDEQLSVEADPDRLQQILCNLINNAIKFSDVGVIRVTVQDEGEKIRLAVTDSGIGIELAAQSRIFEAFEQADGSLSRRHEGAGLGLAICKRLVELHGGQIGVQSTPGFGSTFWFTLNKTSSK